MSRDLGLDDLNDGEPLAKSGLSKSAQKPTRTKQSKKERRVNLILRESELAGLQALREKAETEEAELTIANLTRIACRIAGTGKGYKQATKDVLAENQRGKPIL